MNNHIIPRCGLSRDNHRPILILLLLCCLPDCLPSFLPACCCCAAEGGENELMDMAIQALEHSRALTSEESMMMATGVYGAGGMAGSYGGSAGGILDGDASTTIPSNTGLEAGESNAPAAKPSTPAPAPAATRSAALPAHQSAGLLAAGLVAAAAFLL